MAEYRPHLLFRELRVARMAVLRQNRFAALEHEVSVHRCTGRRVAYTHYYSGSACSVWVATHCECDSCELQRIDNPDDAAFEWPDEGFPVHPHPHAKLVQADLDHERTYYPHVKIELARLEHEKMVNLKQARRACLCSPRCTVCPEPHTAKPHEVHALPVPSSPQHQRRAASTPSTSRVATTCRRTVSKHEAASKP